MTAGQEVSGGVKGKFLLTLSPQIRYAVYREFRRVNTPTIRDLVLAGLAARGWTQERIQREYLAYSAQCAQKGKRNLFPGGRV